MRKHKKLLAAGFALLLAFAAVCPVYAACDSQTVLMLHCDGTNLSTTIIDDSPSAHTMTAQSTALLHTLGPKFGTADLFLDGLTGYVSTPSSTDFDFPGDFTVDFWIKMTSTAGDQCVVGRNTNQFFISFTSPGIWIGINGAQSSIFALTLDTTTWHHVEWDRSGSTNTVYWDGTSVGTYSNSGSISESTELDIGRRTNGSWFFSGDIDELRVTKGLARHTSNFTPATSAYCGAATAVFNLACQGVG